MIMSYNCDSAVKNVFLVSFWLELFFFFFSHPVKALLLYCVSELGV